VQVDINLEEKLTYRKKKRNSENIWDQSKYMKVKYERDIQRKID
jgi:hypothetical protein